MGVDGLILVNLCAIFVVLCFPFWLVDFEIKIEREWEGERERERERERSECVC